MNYKTKQNTPAYNSLAAYRYGGMKKKKKYAAGGMYGDNTVSAAGQVGNTSSIVFEESDPAVLQAKIEAMKQEQERIKLQSDNQVEEIKQDQEEGEASVENAAQDVNTKAESYAKTGASILDMTDQATDGKLMSGELFGKSAAEKFAASNPDPLGIRSSSKLLSGKPLSLNSFSTPSPGLSLQSTQLSSGTLGAGTLGGGSGGLGSSSLIDKSSSLFKPTDLSSTFTPNAIPGVTPPTSGLPSLGGTPKFNPALMGDKPVSLSTDLMNASKTKLLETGVKETTKAAGTGLMNTGAGVGAAGVGTGASKFLTSGAGIGTVASLAGMGVSALADDGDATKLNFGEGTGATLSGIGTGIGAAALAGTVMGSAVPLVGNLIGAGVGAIYGLGKALIGRNKARKAKKEYEAKIKEKKDKYNKELVSKVTNSASNVRAAETQSKTYSGYDLGSNVTYKTGGMMKPLMKY
tara:strand:+ start:9235 stop:10623 length:1389 start_codon:yes stop_codon:yes gene_type:complete